MYWSLVIGIVLASNAESTVDQLLELGCAPEDISVIMTNEDRARNIIDDFGPFESVTADGLEKELAGRNVSQGRMYEEEVKKGKAFIAAVCSSEILDAAQDAFADNYATHVRVI